MIEDLFSEFRKETEAVFDLSYLEKERSPFCVGDFNFQSLITKRVNHYCIKSSENAGYVFGEIDSDEFRRFIKYIEGCTLEMGFDVKNRYCFVTIDQGWVGPDETLRDAGWHLDGLQGDEVPIKKAADLQFIWSDILPTTFTSQKFDVKGLNPSVHNVFNWVAKQIDKKKVIETQPFNIYAMNSYHAHRATEATERVHKHFIRVSYTFIPVTSKRMTVNPEMKYNYEYHKTTGEIPSYLE